MARQPWAPGTDFNTLSSQKQNLSNKLKQRQQRGLSSPQYQQRLKLVNKQLKGMSPTPVASIPSPTEINPVASIPSPVEDLEKMPTIDMGMDETRASQARALFPSIRAMEPENYMGSPLYDFQQKKGEDSIKKLLAKRGLLNSGAEIEAISNFNTELGAMESDKARGYAEKEADRLERIQMQEANRLMNRDDANFDRAYRWTELMLRQNPMQYAMGGLDTYGNNILKQAGTEADYLKNLYPRQVGGGGGGGGGQMPFIAPFPSGPDYSQIEQLEALNKGSSSGGFFNSIIKGIGSLF